MAALLSSARTQRRLCCSLNFHSGSLTKRAVPAAKLWRHIVAVLDCYQSPIVAVTLRHKPQCVCHIVTKHVTVRSGASITWNCICLAAGRRLANL